MDRTITLIVGRTGSGKTRLVNELINNYNMNVVKSYTTRPKRNKGDNGYKFISDADMYPDKLAHTVIDGYEYFTLAKDIQSKDIYVVDPKGVIDLAEKLPEMTFKIYYVYADKETRAMVAGKRDGKQNFLKRDASEDAMFTEFENRIHDKKNPLPDNIYGVVVIKNDYTPASIGKWAQCIYENHILVEELTPIVRQVMHKVFKTVSNDKIELDFKDRSIEVTPEYIAMLAITDSDLSSRIFMTYLLNKKGD